MAEAFQKYIERLDGKQLGQLYKEKKGQSVPVNEHNRRFIEKGLVAWFKETGGRGSAGPTAATATTTATASSTATATATAPTASTTTSRASTAPVAASRSRPSSRSRGRGKSVESFTKFSGTNATEYVSRLNDKDMHQAIKHYLGLNVPIVESSRPTLEKKLIAHLSKSPVVDPVVGEDSGDADSENDEMEIDSTSSSRSTRSTRRSVTPSDENGTAPAWKNQSQRGKGRGRKQPGRTRSRPSVLPASAAAGTNTTTSIENLDADSVMMDTMDYSTVASSTTASSTAARPASQVLPTEEGADLLTPTARPPRPSRVNWASTPEVSVSPITAFSDTDDEPAETKPKRPVSDRRSTPYRPLDAAGAKHRRAADMPGGVQSPAGEPFGVTRRGRQSIIVSGSRDLMANAGAKSTEVTERSPLGVYSDSELSDSEPIPISSPAMASTFISSTPNRVQSVPAPAPAAAAAAAAVPPQRPAAVSPWRQVRNMAERLSPREVLRRFREARTEELRQRFRNAIRQHPASRQLPQRNGTTVNGRTSRQWSFGRFDPNLISTGVMLVIGSVFVLIFAILIVNSLRQPFAGEQHEYNPEDLERMKQRLIVANIGVSKEYLNKLQPADLNRAPSCLNYLSEKLNDHLADWLCSTSSDDYYRGLPVSVALANLPECQSVGVDLNELLLGLILVYGSQVKIGAATNDGKPAPDVHSIVTLVRTQERLPWLCWTKLKLWNLGSYLLVIVVGCLFVGSTVWIVRAVVWRLRRRKQTVRMFVGRIVDAVREQHEKYESCISDVDYVVQQHLRDTLIAADLRREQWPLWQKAVDEVAKYESRIRPAYQHLDSRGLDEEVAVWRWVAADTTGPHSSSTPVQPPKGGTQVPVQSATGLRTRFWQGSAHQNTEQAETILQRAGNQATECLKLRGLFDSNAELAHADWVTDVKNAVLQQVGADAQVVDVHVDSQSKEGIVYVKCMTVVGAAVAFSRLHGQFFDGRCVSVKFIRLDRYNERFKDSRYAATVLRPSTEITEHQRVRNLLRSSKIYPTLPS